MMIDSIQQYRHILPILAEFVAKTYNGNVFFKQDSNNHTFAVSLKISISVIVSDFDFEILSEDLAPHDSLVYFCESYLDDADLRRFNTLFQYSIEFGIKISKSQCNLMFFFDFTDESILRNAFQTHNYMLIKDILTNCVMTNGIVSVLDQMAFFGRTLSLKMQDAFLDVIRLHHPGYYGHLRIYLTPESIKKIIESETATEFNIT